jgi:lipopolysaccharide transport system permease protein
MEPNYIREPKRGWHFINFKELWGYRDLLFFLVKRDIKVQYAQSVLGIAWAVLQPVVTMIIFTIIFGKLAKISSDGAPYAIFSYSALVPWTYFSTSVTEATNSLVASSTMITKVYFPRPIMPLTPVLSKLLDFVIAFLILVGLMGWYKIVPTKWILVLPFLVFVLMLTALGVSMWLAPLAIQYRDVKYGMGFGVRILMYAAPVVYPVSLIPERYRLLYGLNPMAGVIEGFRSALLGTVPMPWDLIGVGALIALVIAIGGSFYFQHAQRVFADVV